MGCMQTKPTTLASAPVKEASATLLQGPAPSSGSLKGCPATSAKVQPEAETQEANEVGVQEEPVLEARTAVKQTEVTDKVETIYITQTSVEPMPAASRTAKRKSTPWVKKESSDDSLVAVQDHESDRRSYGWLFATCCHPQTLAEPERPQDNDVCKDSDDDAASP